MRAGSRSASRIAADMRMCLKLHLYRMLGMIASVAFDPSDPVLHDRFLSVVKCHSCLQRGQSHIARVKLTKRALEAFNELRDQTPQLNRRDRASS